MSRLVRFLGTLVPGLPAGPESALSLAVAFALTLTLALASRSSRLR